MGKYIRITRTYLVLITVFVLLRFTLELIQPGPIPYSYYEVDFNKITSEISLTRLFFVLPVFLGLRFASGSLNGWKQMVIANLTYVTWGMFLLIVLRVVDESLALETHYGLGKLVPTSLGQVISMNPWHGGGVRHPLPVPIFCSSILLMTVVTNVLCFVTIKLHGKSKEDEQRAE